MPATREKGRLELRLESVVHVKSSRHVRLIKSGRLLSYEGPGNAPAPYARSLSYCQNVTGPLWKAQAHQPTHPELHYNCYSFHEACSECHLNSNRRGQPTWTQPFRPRAEIPTPTRLRPCIRLSPGQDIPCQNSMLCLRCLLHPSPALTALWKTTQDKLHAAWASRQRKLCQKGSSSIHVTCTVPTPQSGL